MAVIYQQYRPKKFAEVIGQEHIKRTITSEIIENHLSHAYLFVGPRGTGKTTLARLIARAINCDTRKKDSAEPCNNCMSCKQILNDQFLDLIEIDAATHTQVDNVRDNIIVNARVPALKLHGYKIFIVDEVHMLSKHAFNALLKTIEEPPSRVIFILATTDVHKVPGTIISRCERYDFKKIPQKLIVEKLTSIAKAEGIAVPASIIDAVAKRSEGCMRDAESLFGQILSIAEKGSVDRDTAELIVPPSNWQMVSKLLDLLTERSLPGSLTYVHQLVQEGVDLELFMVDALEYLRQLLLVQSIGTSYVPDVDEHTQTQLREHAQKISTQDTRRLLELFMRENVRMRSAVIQQLPLELLCVAYCSEATALSVDQNPQTAPQTDTTNAVTDKDYQNLKQAWPSLIASLKDYNHSLSVFLKSAHPVSITNNSLMLGFKYDFHAKTIRESRNRQTVEEAISKLLRRQVTIDAEVDPQYTDNHKKFNGGAEPEVADVLSVIGGEIV